MTKNLILYFFKTTWMILENTHIRILNLKIILELWSWIEILNSIPCKRMKLGTKSLHVFQRLSTICKTWVDLIAKKNGLRKSFLYYLIIFMPKLPCYSQCKSPLNIQLNGWVGQVFELYHFLPRWEQSTFEEGKYLANKTSRIVVRANMFLTKLLEMMTLSIRKRKMALIAERFPKFLRKKKPFFKD